MSNLKWRQVNAWKCTECHRVQHDDEILRTPNPFRPTEYILGCVACRCVQTLELLCEVESCILRATCGTSISEDKYRIVCGIHLKIINI